MAGFMVFDTTTLTFETYLPDDVDAATYEKIQGGVDQIIDVTGDLQPYTPRGSEQLPVPSGFTLDSAKWFATPNGDLPTIDDVGASRAARTTINNRTYYVFRKMDYSNGFMFTDGFEYVLVLEKYEEGSV